MSDTLPADQQPIVTDTAFICYRDSNGHWVATSDLEKKVVVTRKSNRDDFVCAATLILRDIQAEQIGNTVMAMQTQAAMQMAEQIQAQKIAEGIKDGKGVVDLARFVRPG